MLDIYPYKYKDNITQYSIVWYICIYITYPYKYITYTLTYYIAIPVHIYYILQFIVVVMQAAGTFSRHMYIARFSSPPLVRLSHVRRLYVLVLLPSVFLPHLQSICCPLFISLFLFAFFPPLQDIVDTHPGLTFLKDAPEFHSRYITTVNCTVYITPVCLSPNAETPPLLLFWPLREWCDSRAQLIAWWCSQIWW